MPKYRTVTDVVYTVEAEVEASTVEAAEDAAIEDAKGLPLGDPTYYVEVARAPD